MAVSTWLLFTALLAGVCGQLEWERLHDGVGLAPSARVSMGFGYDPVSNKIIVFGGSPGPMNDTWIYDVTTGIWREVVVTNGPVARFSIVSGVSNGSFFISTGEGAGKVFFNDIWRFNIGTEIWEKLPAPEGVAPEVRYGSIGGIFTNGGDEFYVNMGFAAVRYPNTYIYSITEQKWTLENCGNCNDYDPSHPHSRCLHTGTMIDKDEFILFGGCLGGGATGGPCPGGDSWRYNGKSKTWKRLPDCAAPRIYGAMALLPSSSSKKRVVMYGGQDTSKSVINTEGIQADQISVFDPDTDEWTIRKTAAAPSNNYPAKRQKAGMVTAPNGIYMFGGISSASMNDLWILKGNADNIDDGEKVDCTSNFIDFLTIHAIFMVAGWGVLLQWGAFIARYMKFKDPLWFNLHRGFQVSGLVLSICGLAFAIVSVPFDHLKFPHAIIGIIVMILGILQPVNAIIRPHKPPVGQDKSLRRNIWEFIHLNCGRTALVFALINISLGVLLSVTATHNLIIWFVYLAILVLAYIIAEVLKCVKEKNSDKTDSFKLERKM